MLEPIKAKYFLSYQVVSLHGADNIRNLPALLSLHGLYGKTKAVIVLLDEEVLSTSLTAVIERVEDQIRSSSIPVNTSVLYIEKTLKEKLLSKSISESELQGNALFEILEGFISGIAEDYYDPVTVTPLEVLKSRLDSLTWNDEDGEVRGIDEYTDHSITLNSIEELLDYLNDEVIEAMHGEMPLEWLKEQDSLDYDTEIREYLLEHYSKEIERVGWNVNEL